MIALFPNANAKVDRIPIHDHTGLRGGGSSIRAWYDKVQRSTTRTHVPRDRFAMSRFFATGDTDSSSESSDDEPRLVGGTGGTTGGAIGAK